MLTPERLQVHVQALDKQVRELAAIACGTGNAAAAAQGAAHKIVGNRVCWACVACLTPRELSSKLAVPATALIGHWLIFVLPPATCRTA